MKIPAKRFALPALLLGITFFPFSKAEAFNEIMYVQTNDFHPGANAVLAYRHTGDGKMMPLPGSPFKTGGTGNDNTVQELGPADSDQELFMTDNKKFLLAVNSGSNDITVFRVAKDGSLAPVSGSPFSSGGEVPVSLCVSGKYVYVVNKSQDPKNPTMTKPNYVTMMMDDDGRLTLMPNAKFETMMGVSPAQALLSENKKMLFGADFLGFMQKPPVGTLRSFMVHDGMLKPVPGTPMTIPEKGGALGLWQHPKADVLYVGFPLAGKVGVYGIGKDGKLMYKTSVMAGPAACWLRTNRKGTHLYSLNSGENSISAYNTSDAMMPKSINKLMLKEAGPKYEVMGMPMVTSQDFAFALSGDERFMYVVCQHTNKDFSVGNYNYLHVVNVADDGRISEPGEPMQLPVSAMQRPKGCVVYSLD